MMTAIDRPDKRLHPTNLTTSPKKLVAMQEPFTKGHYQESPKLSDMLKLSDILDTVRTSAALAPLHKAVPFPQAILGMPRPQLRHR
jgi:hypothetical protein